MIGVYEMMLNFGREASLNTIKNRNETLNQEKCIKMNAKMLIVFSVENFNLITYTSFRYSMLFPKINSVFHDYYYNPGIFHFHA